MSDRYEEATKEFLAIPIPKLESDELPRTSDQHGRIMAFLAFIIQRAFRWYEEHKGTCECPWADTCPKYNDHRRIVEVGK